MRRDKAPTGLRRVEWVPTAAARQPDSTGALLCVGAVIIEADTDFDAATLPRVRTVVAPC